MDWKAASRSVGAALAVGLLCAVAVTATGCGARRAEQARQMGDIHLRNNDVAGAKTQYERALELDPKNAAAKLGLANCLRLSNEPALALDAYKDAIDLNPKLTDAYVNATQLLLSQKKYEDAENIAEQFKSVDEEKGGILQAAVQRAAGHVDQAVSLLEDLRTQFPKSVPVRITLAMDYLAADKADKAESELKNVLDKIAPDSVTARMALIEVYRREGKLPQIQKELKGMLKEAKAKAAKNPDDPKLKNRVDGIELQLALSLLENKQPQKALDIAEPILKDSPDSPWANYVYGSCMLALKRYDEAEQALQTAAAALPEEPQITKRLALAKAGGRSESEAASPAPAATASASTPAPAPAQAQEGTATTPKPQAGSAPQATPQAQPTPAAPAKGNETWQDLYKQARLQALLDRRDEFEKKPEPALDEALVLAAMFTGNGPLMDELMKKLPDTSPVRKLIDALRKQDVETVRKTLDSWKEDDPLKDCMRRDTEGYVYSLVGLRGRALQTLFEAIQKYPDNAVSYFNIARMYNAAGMPDFAARSLNRLLRMYSNSLDARILLYRTQRRAGHMDEARSTAETTYGLYPDDQQVILNLADVYLETGSPDMTLTVLRHGVKVLPDSPAMHLALGIALLRVGQDNEIAATLKGQTFAASDAARAAELKAFVAASAAKWDDVRKDLDSVPASDLSVAGRLLHAAATVQSGDTDAALKEVQDLDKKVPANHAKVYLLAAALGATESDLGDAAPFVNALKKSPDAVSQYAYALAAMETRAYQDAYKALLSLEKKVGAQPPVVSLLFASLAPSTAGSDRIKHAEALKAREPDSLEAALGMAAVYASAGKTDKQGELIKKAVQSFPDSKEAWMALALYYTKVDKEKDAIGAYRNLIEKGATDPRIFNNYAYFLLSTGGDKAEALKYADKAVKTLKSDPHAIHTLGLAQLESGDLDKAKANLSKALEMLPGDPTLMLDLGRALIATGKKDEGKKYVQQAVRNADMLGLDFPRRQEAQKILGNA